MITYSKSGSPRPVGTVAHHVCDDGYVLVGGDIRTCEDNGQFGGVAPTCERKCIEIGNDITLPLALRTK